MLRTAVGRLRVVGLLEGTSFLALVGVAMPLKHLLHMPMPVKVVGWAHGLLFVLYLLALAHAQSQKIWSPGRTALLFLAPLLPGGPFLFDGWLKRQQ